MLDDVHASPLPHAGFRTRKTCPRATFHNGAPNPIDRQQPQTFHKPTNRQLKLTYKFSLF